MSLQFAQTGEAEPRAAVLIVGTGPAGLFASCELVRHGVKPRVVERRLAPASRGARDRAAAGDVGHHRAGWADRAISSHERAHPASSTARTGFAGNLDQEIRRYRMQV